MKNLLTKTKQYVIGKEWILVFLLFFPFIYKVWLPDGSSIYFLDIIRHKWKIVSLVIITILFIIKKKKPSKLFILSLVIEIWTLIITFIKNPSGMKETILFVSAVLSISGIIELFIDDLDNLLNGLLLNFEIFLYLNFITILLYHSTRGYNGAHYLLGYYNTMMVFVYPAIALAFIYMFKNKKYVRPILLIVISVLTIVLAGGSTPLGSLIASIGVVILYLLLQKFNIKTKHLNLILFILAVAFCIFILFFFVGGKFKLIDFIIEKVLNRNTTFTGRFPIWAKAEEMILNNPIFGYGREVQIEATPGWFLTHAHNTYLTNLVFTGLIGFIPFMIMNVMIVNKLDKQRNCLLKYILAGLLFGIFISFVTEAYQKEFMFYIIYFLAYNIDKIKIESSNK